MTVIKPKVFTGTLGAGQYTVYDSPQTADLTINSETSDTTGLISSTGANMTVAWSGEYVVYATVTQGNNQWGGQAGTRLAVLVNGAEQSLPTTGQTIGSVDGNAARPHCFWRGYITAGQYITIRQVNMGGGYNHTISSGYVQVVYLGPIPSA